MDVGSSEESLKVLVRVRPVSKTKDTPQPRLCAHVIPQSGNKRDFPTQIVLGESVATGRPFTFDHVLDMTSSQEDVMPPVKELVSNWLCGLNATVLAYGQTGSGKTYTMGSAISGGETAASLGVIPRVVNMLFEAMTAEPQGIERKVRVSFLELYREDVRDLLGGDKPLAIREDQGVIHIPGLTEVECDSAEGMMALLLQGSEGRTTASTRMNDTSSRSHAIFSVTLETRNAETDSTTLAKFHFVDLAGSERVKRTQASGERLREGIAINSGLLALGNVISALGAPKGSKPQHIPYRDSKLTRLLQDSLGGNSKTLMIACVSPVDTDFEETLNTLKYADRAKNIKNKPIVNEIGAGAAGFSAAALEKAVEKATAAARAEAEALRAQCETLEYENGRLKGSLQGMEARVGGLNAALLQASKERDYQTLRLQASLAGKPVPPALEDPACEDHISVVEKQGRIILELKAQLEENDALIAALQNGILKGRGKPSATSATSSSSSPKKRLSSSSALKVSSPSKRARLLEDLSAGAGIGIGVGAEEEEDGAMDDNHNGVGGEDDHHDDDGFAEAQAQLTTLTQDIAMKEKLVGSMKESAEQFHMLRSEYESKLHKLEDEIQQLGRERDTVIKNLQQQSESSQEKINAIKAEYERKITQLRKDLDTHRQRDTEYQRLVRLRADGEARMKVLNEEISTMKKNRVELKRRLEAESKKREEWRVTNNRELARLRKEARAAQIEAVQLKVKNTRQEALLTRRLEEIHAAHRRLRDYQRGIKPSDRDGAATLSGSTAAAAAAAAAVGPSRDRRWAKQWLDAEMERFLRKKAAIEGLDEELARREAMRAERAGLVDEERALQDDNPAKADLRMRLETVDEAIQYADDRIADAQRRLMEVSDDVPDNGEALRIGSDLAVHEVRMLLEHTVQTVLALRDVDGQRQRRLEDLQQQLKDTAASLAHLHEANSALERDLQSTRNMHQLEVMCLFDEIARMEADREEEKKEQKGGESEDQQQQQELRMRATNRQADVIMKVAEEITGQMSKVAEEAAMVVEDHDHDSDSSDDHDGSEDDQGHDGDQVMADATSAAAGAAATAAAAAAAASAAPSAATRASAKKSASGPARGTKTGPAAAPGSAVKKAPTKRPLTAAAAAASVAPEDKDVFERLATGPRPTTAAAGAAVQPGSSSTVSVSISVADMRSRVREKRKDGKDAAGTAAPSSTSTTTTTTAATAIVAADAVIEDKENPGKAALKKEAADVFSRLHKVTGPADKYKVLPGQTPAVPLSMEDADLDLESCVADIKAYDIVLDMCRAQNSVQLFCGSADKNVKLWDIRALHKVTEMVGHERRVSTVASTVDAAFASPTSLVFSGSSDKTVRAWSASSGVHVMTLDAGSAVHSLAVYGDLVYAGLDDGGLRVWDIRTWEMLEASRAVSAKSSIFSLAATASGLVAGCRDGSLLEFDPRTLQYTHRFTAEKHYSGVTTLAGFSLSGAGYLLSGSRDKSLRVYRTDGAKPGAQVFYDRKAHREGVNKAKVFKDTLFTASADRSIVRWAINPDPDLNGLSLRRSNCLVGHAASVESLCVVQDVLVSGSLDKSIKLWRAVPKQD